MMSPVIIFFFFKKLFFTKWNHEDNIEYWAIYQTKGMVGYVWFWFVFDQKYLLPTNLLGIGTNPPCMWQLQGLFCQTPVSFFYIQAEVPLLLATHGAFRLLVTTADKQWPQPVKWSLGHARSPEDMSAFHRLPVETELSRGVVRSLIF